MEYLAAALAFVLVAVAAVEAVLRKTEKSKLKDAKITRDAALAEEDGVQKRLALDIAESEHRVAEAETEAVAHINKANEAKDTADAHRDAAEDALAKADDIRRSRETLETE